MDMVTNDNKHPLEEQSEIMPAKAKKAMVVVSVCMLCVIAAIGIAGWRAGLFTSTDALHGFLGRMGVWAPVVFILIQILQVVVPIIPGGVTCTVGVITFGLVQGLIYDYIGQLPGSFLAFVFARRKSNSKERKAAPTLYMNIWKKKEATCSKKLS